MADVALVRVRLLEPLDLPFQPLNMALDLKKSYALLEFMSHSKAIRPTNQLEGDNGAEGADKGGGGVLRKLFLPDAGKSLLLREAGDHLAPHQKRKPGSDPRLTLGELPEQEPKGGAHRGPSAP